MPTPLVATAVLGAVAALAVIPAVRPTAALAADPVVLSVPTEVSPTSTSTSTAPDRGSRDDAVAMVSVGLWDRVRAAFASAEDAAAAQSAELTALAAMPDATAVPTVTVDPSVVLSSGFVRPVDAPVVSTFGLRFHPILHVWKLHTGTDLGAACGTPVKAAKAGTVEFAGNGGGYGNRVVIAHGGGLETTYNHLTSYAATVGLAVKQGQVIGYVGTTGLSTGCHLHFEVMVKGQLVDPNPFLDLAPSPRVTIPPAVAAVSSASSLLVSPSGHALPAPATPTTPAATTPAPASTPAPTEAGPSESSSTTAATTSTSSSTTSASASSTTSSPSSTTAEETPSTTSAPPTSTQPEQTTPAP